MHLTKNSCAILAGDPGRSDKKKSKSVSHKDTKARRKYYRSENRINFVCFVASCEKMINPNQRVEPTA